MSGIRDYIWILPFIGSILAAISIFTPAAVISSGSGQLLQYMDGFYVILGRGTPEFGFVDIPILMIVGIVCLILMLTSTIIMFISSLTHRKSDAPASWIVLGILFIGGAIYYIAGTEVGYMIYGMINYDMQLSFWDIFDPSFGAIAPFISGGLSILGYIISKSVGKEQMEITPISKDITPVSKEEALVSEAISQPIPIEESQSIKFCPACGEKIPSAEAKFCPGCGQNL
ncbi:MAG: hypothetical protein CEE43_01380 [Promethearchaeota archaeon Loki_b32]|nr:MAG: hypothetical protein CEE43_01380 [Candidatus Lokiarchaeota archaeon Loki_b32]